MLDRYAAASGRDLSNIDFYVAFGWWKLACILEGVYARYVGGAMGGRGDAGSFDFFGQQVVTLFERAREAAARVS
jgi:aminoglycoside phosphotransferase (APT) family kinase protein